MRCLSNFTFDRIAGSHSSAATGQRRHYPAPRAHIHVEAKLLELLEPMVPDPEHLEKMGLGFSQRGNLAVALGLKAEHAPALSALGNLRNAFAHRLDATLSNERVNSLYATLSSEDKEIVQHAYQRTNVQIQRTDSLPFGDLGPKERFSLISVASRTILMAAIAEIHGRQRDV